VPSALVEPDAAGVRCGRGRTCLVAFCDALLIVLFVMAYLLVMSLLGFVFMFYLMLLLLLTLLLIPATLCTDATLPSAATVLQPASWLLSQPYVWLNQAHDGAKISLRACIKLPHSERPESQ
jgi:hypothetical protein